MFHRRIGAVNMKNRTKCPWLRAFLHVGWAGACPRAGPRLRWACPERCRSGRSGGIGNAVCPFGYRGFESRPLRSTRRPGVPSRRGVPMRREARAAGIRTRRPGRAAAGARGLDASGAAKRIPPSPFPSAPRVQPLGAFPCVPRVGVPNAAASHSMKPPAEAGGGGRLAFPPIARPCARGSHPLATIVGPWHRDVLDTCRAGGFFPGASHAPRVVARHSRRRSTSSASARPFSTIGTRKARFGNVWKSFRSGSGPGAPVRQIFLPLSMIRR